MTHEEKNAWIMLVVSVVAYTVYVITVLGRVDGGPLIEVRYAVPLLWTVGGSIVTTIVASIGIGLATPKASRLKDVRDRQISRLGEQVGHSFVVIGALAAMLMAMAEWDPFWIANVVYLCFVLSAVFGSVARVAVYRGSMPQW